MKRIIICASIVLLCLTVFAYSIYGGLSTTDMGMDIGISGAANPSGGGLVLESGDYLLLETGGFLLLESG